MYQQSEQRSCASCTSPHIARPKYSKRESMSRYSTGLSPPSKTIVNDILCNVSNPLSKAFDTAPSTVSMDILHVPWAYGSDENHSDHVNPAQLDNVHIPMQSSATPFRTLDQGLAVGDAFASLTRCASASGDLDALTPGNAPATIPWTSPHDCLMHASGLDTPSSTDSNFWTQATTPATTITENFDLGQPFYDIDTTVASTGAAVNQHNQYNLVDDFADNAYWNPSYVPDLNKPDLDLEHFKLHLPEQVTASASVPLNGTQTMESNRSATGASYCQVNNGSLQKYPTPNALTVNTNTYPPLPDLSPSDLFDTFENLPWTGYAEASSLSELKNVCLDPISSYDLPYTCTAELEDLGSVGSQVRLASGANVDRGRKSIQHNSSIPRDTERDAFLLDCKAKGMSYKEIKTQGGFHEAESTLRGRYRTLTKPKIQRVRKPAWTNRDIMILKQTVSTCLRHAPSTAIYQQPAFSSNARKTTRQALSKISWKQVAESMVDQGCYHYGNATVKKKYMQVMGIQ